MSVKSYEYKLNDKRLIDANGNTSIPIYENDLKYKKYNNIDIKRVNGDINYDKDTIEYRFYECIKDNAVTLDLSHLDLLSFPHIPQNIISNIKYLFLSENKLSHLPDLSLMENLVVVDLCNNNLESVPTLPIGIEELLVINNKITNIDTLSQYPLLKRLNCSNNMIHTIPIIDSIEILICDNNKIEYISHKLPKLIKLMISNNKIKILPNYDNLRILEIENNALDNINGCKNLVELYCNNTNINNLSGLNKIEIIHCYKTRITKLEYFDTLKELLCDYRADMTLSKYYKIIKSDVFDEIIVLINFQ
ncbi:hypothetical protein Indivirus_2_13 [Indivirus ILV1]|uniref:Leucine-rich repeat protein n=1 Tax=Indivirus ILV1 TaxID=1977633 RepID=A0A1V0SDC7_9VIRU|nr:hypothetical protein Indivirus_2_13 [Indivirus ILV1]